MSHLDFDKETKKKSNWKGFYLALALCLVAIGGVGVVTLMSVLPLQTEDPASSDTTAPTTTPTQPVGQVVTGVPDDRKTTTTAPTTTTTTAAPTTAAPADLFVLPLTNEVIRGFSGGQPVYSTTMNDWRVHDGVDFRGEAGQDVKALADGTIKSLETDPLWGGVLTIDHGHGIVSTYRGVTAVGVEAGQVVKVGQIIGTLSEIPCEAADGAHLHLEITANGSPIDPVEAIGREVKTTDG